MAAREAPLGGAPGASGSGAGPGAVSGVPSGPGPGPAGPVSFCQYGVQVPMLDLFQVARLHGFETPDSAVEWAKERRRAAKLAKAEAAELWPLPEEEIGP